MSAEMDIDIREGLSFADARAKVLLCLKGAIANRASSKNRFAAAPYYLFGLSIIIALLIISIGVETVEILFSGYLTSILAIGICAFLNILAILQYRRSSETDTHNELQWILSHYQRACEWDVSKAGSEDSKNYPKLSAGHSHISIVNCFRSKHWQRIPSLLLADGDIIALQVGDIAPGKCVEMFHQSSSSPNHHHVHSQPIEQGTRILLREGQLNNNFGPISSSSSKTNSQYQRHKALAPDGLELLQLSGDTRCFRLLETPITSFVTTLLQEEAKIPVRQNDIFDKLFTMNPTSKAPIVLPGDSGNRTSLLRVLICDIGKRGVLIWVGVVVMLLVCAAIRFSLVDSSRYHYTQSILLPVVASTLCFFPLSLPGLLILVECLSTSDLLATTEALLLLEDEESENGVSKPVETKNPVAEAAGVASGASRNAGGGRSHSEERSNRESNVSNVGSRRRMTTESGVNNSNTYALDSPVVSPLEQDEEEGSEDEFLDEDIDERAEEIADEASTNVAFSRRLQYLFAVVARRLCLIHGNSSDDEYRFQASGVNCGAVLLPIPPARRRILEFLGGVTMVCFVDNDVICEGYSVTEEIFLMSATDGGTRHREEVASVNSNKQSASNTAAGVKGIVLDLHANSEANGCRFEDPMWWKFLPNLKPMGLNAMLTYSPILPLVSTVLQSHSGSEDGTKRQHSGSGTKKGSEVLVCTPGKTLNPMMVSSSGKAVPELLLGVGNQSSALPATPEKEHRRNSKNRKSWKKDQLSSSTNNSQSPHSQHSLDHVHRITEVSLVAEVRTALPLTCLRELAEEIGFKDEDVDSFRRLLEMNVIAPGLCDKKMQEDPHSWGEEDTRRRGMLMTQVRASVTLDTRTGGLQMMSQGDPGLLLHYCEEYWDGASITSFTPADRQEVLGVYDRWKLEDFDVVAFSYTPVPSHLRVLIETAHKESAEFAAEIDVAAQKARSPTVEVDQASQNSSLLRHRKQSNCVFIVDPYTVADLLESRKQTEAPQLQVAAGSSHPADKKPVGAAVHSEGEKHDFVEQSEGHAGYTSLTTTEIPTQEYSRKSSRADFIPAPIGFAEHEAEQTINPFTHTMYKLLEVDQEDDSGVPVSARSVGGASEYQRILGAEHDEERIQPLPPENDREVSRSGKAVGTNTDEMKQLQVPTSLGGNTRKATISEAAHSYYLNESGDAFSVENEDEYEDGDRTAHSSDQRERCVSESSASVRVLNEMNDIDADSVAEVEGEGDYFEIDENDPESKGIAFSQNSFGVQSNNGMRDMEIDVSTEAYSTDRDEPSTASPRTIKAFREQFRSGRTFSGGGGMMSSRQHHSTGQLYEGGPQSNGEEFPNPQRVSIGGGYYLDPEGDQSLAVSVESSVQNAYGDPIEFGGNSLSMNVGDSAIPNDELTDPSLSMSILIAASEAEAASNIGMFIENDELTPAVTPRTPRTPLTPLTMTEAARSDRGNSIDQVDLNEEEKDLLASVTETVPHITRSISEDVLNNAMSGLSSGLTTKAVEKLSRRHRTSSRPPLLDESQENNELFRNRSKSVSSKKAKTRIMLWEQENAGIADITVGSKSKKMSKRKLASGGIGQSTNSKKMGDVSSGGKQVPAGAAKNRSLGASLWPSMRQQVFLGMAASSVPVKPEVADLKEELTKAGVRFVYFSPRNMRRSKPIAEKIGIQFDWNCAISLRDLEGNVQYDPHRAISSYGDWDVHARMPHGVAAIKKHLQEVDNVPLLVSLYTDATPDTIQQMVRVFQDYGEVVLSIGSGYREHNQRIFNTSDVAVSVDMIPGSTEDIPVSVTEVVQQFPKYSDHSLMREDILLHFRLVGLGSMTLLQLPGSGGKSHCDLDNNAASGVPVNRNNTKPSSSSATPDVHQAPKTNTSNYNNSDSAHDKMEIPFSLDQFPGKATENFGPKLRLSALLEGIRMGRIYLLNSVQAVAVFTVCSLCLGLWPVLANALPINIPPYLPVPLVLLFVFVYIPFLALAVLHGQAPDSVMKATPRKNIYSRRDESRFVWFLALRTGLISLCTFLVGWSAIVSLFSFPDIARGRYPSPYSWFNGCIEFQYVQGNDKHSWNKYFLVQDVVSSHLLLALIAQTTTLLERGSKSHNILYLLKEQYLFGAVCIGLCVLHGLIMALRAYLRGSLHGYTHLHWIVWTLVLVLPLLTLALGRHLNAVDAKSYHRYLQFLRLEFDTRLGMHSPR